MQHSTPTPGTPPRRVRFTHRCTAPVIQHGFTLVELLMAMAIGTILLLAIQGVVGRGLQTQQAVQTQNEITRQAHFAMQQMVRAVSRTRQVLIPSAENPNTAWPESVREFPPRIAYPNETAVLALLVDPEQDLDTNGIPDVDNDGDGLVDEDPGGDMNFDLAPGLFGIDDDNDGTVDEQHSLSSGPLNEDDDEDDYANEDLVDGVDADGDGKVDEDIKKQTDGNNLAGAGGVDDDGDGSIDEGDKNDDDEDGSVDEDWYDTAVFYLDNGSLIQRVPVPYDVNGSGGVDGRDVITQTVAENVTAFRVEHILQASGRAVQIDLALELTSPATGEVVSLGTRVRIGGAL